MIFIINLLAVTTVAAFHHVSDRDVFINTSHELQSWLCDNSTTLLNDNMTLYLNQLNYALCRPRFCHIKNRYHLTLVGNVSTGQTSIHCTHKNDSSVGFGFFNMNYFVIKNLKFLGCGATITSQAVRIFNDTHPYLGVGQKAVLVFNHCQNLSIMNVNITGGYYGYGLMLLNTMGLLDNTNLVDGIVLNCTTNIDFSCAGSGLIIVFKDTVLTMKESNDYSEKFVIVHPIALNCMYQEIYHITIFIQCFLCHKW